ncbi:hypothetical protein [Yeosuana marina]|uniref:hypothetical protein n=1 Tax=Yeosuana marina TaxID=1565536 RepID=UPI0030C84269
MKLTRRFYNSRVDFRSISKKRVVFAVVVDLAAAVTIYSFSYVMRETFRIISFSFDNFPDIISESNRNFYNLFFAGLSIIFGNSIAINFLLSQPQSMFSRRDLRRNRILNDQIFLNFNFAHWFMKIGFLMGAFSMCCMDFEYLPYFYLPFLLLIIVMFLDTWKALIQVLGIKGYKWLLFHFLILSCLTFGLSRIDIIRYKAIDKIAISRNPIIDLPYSDFYNSENEKRSLVISFKILVNEANELEIYTEDRRKIRLTDISNEIILERASRREELIPFFNVRISADKHIGLLRIKELEAELFSVSQQKVIYNIFNDNLESSRFENRGIKYYISPFVLSFKQNNNIPISQLPPPLPQMFINEVTSFKNTLKIDIGDNVKVNGVIVPKNRLVEIFKNSYSKDMLFEYLYNENTTYQQYITVLSSNFKAVYELREQKQTIFRVNKFDYNKAYTEEQRMLKEQFPIRIIEKRN